MKKLLAMMMVLLLACVGCGQQNDGPVADGTGDFGYICEVTVEDNNVGLGDDADWVWDLVFDEAEWLTAPDDADRLRELNIDPDNLDDGYYIYNPDEETVNVPVASDVKITVLSFKDWTEQELSTIEDFVIYFDANLRDVKIPFWLTVEDGKVTEIRMQYIP